MSGGLRRALAGGCVSLTLLLGACGGGTHREIVVARLGQVRITRDALLHWMKALDTKASEPAQALQRRALAFLISTSWLTEEASAEHVSASAREVQRQVAELRESSGVARLSVADIELEASAELAATNIQRRLIAAEPAPSTAEIIDYYHRHLRAFLLPEERYFDIDNLKSQAAALKVKREVESGRSFARMALHERRSSVLGDNPGRYAIERAIFAARPHVLGGPVLLADAGDHSLFEVTKVVPASYEPLAQVKAAIATKLAAASRRRTLAAFAASWRARWTALTDCRAGYVQPGCRQYAGSQVPPANLGLD